MTMFENRNDIQPILILLPVGHQSHAERLIRKCHAQGWHSFYLHPMADESPNIMDICGVAPDGDHDFLPSSAEIDENPSGASPG